VLRTLPITNIVSAKRYMTDGTLPRHRAADLIFRIPNRFSSKHRKFDLNERSFINEKRYGTNEKNTVQD
jgi:hypothetical protein